MPIPTPTQTETADKFIQRCMSDEIMLNEYPDQSQRFAICSVSYDKEKMQLKNCENTAKNAKSTKPEKF
jgi:hypothetical protein